MTETNEAVIHEALTVIDKALGADDESRAGVVGRDHRRAARRALAADHAGARVEPWPPAV